MNPIASLPTPAAAFHWSREPWGCALRCRPLESVAQHLFTTAQLQLRSAALSPDAWRQAAASLGVEVDVVRRVKQVHGAAVRIISAETVREADPAVPPEGDALVCHVPGQVLAVQVADCVPLLIADPRTGAVAAVHAGWRGTAAGIARAAVDTLSREFGVRPQDLVAAIGPSIGACCYQVGDELPDAFREAGASEEQVAAWFSRDGDERWRLDLWTANVDQLVDAGVRRDQVYLSGLCTQTHADIFDSYRAQGAAAGRMAALVRVPDRPR